MVWASSAGTFADTCRADAGVTGVVYQPFSTIQQGELNKDMS
jgi:hypothetical protein